MRFHPYEETKPSESVWFELCAKSLERYKAQEPRRLLD